MTYDNPASANGGAQGDADGETFKAGIKAARAKLKARRGNGSTPPGAGAGPAEVHVFPGYDAWWTRAPVAPPWVMEARERDAAPREFGCYDPAALVTMYESETTIAKRFDLTRDEATGTSKLKSPESKASLHKATAHQVPFDTLEDFALFRRALRDRGADCNALSYGVFAKSDVYVRTLLQAKQYVDGYVVARAREFMSWHEGPAIFASDADLLDDQNITPGELDELLCNYVWWFSGVDRAYDWSCSSGIEREHDGVLLKPLRNFRLYIVVDDARAIPRLAMELHDAIWRAGRGRVVPSKAGLLDRSILDMTMAQPERLDFIGPSLGEGLRRSAARSDMWIVKGKERRLATAGKGLDLTLAEFHAQSKEYKEALDRIRPAEAAFIDGLVAEAAELARKEGRDVGAAVERAKRLYGDGAVKQLEDSDPIILADGRIVTAGEIGRDLSYDGQECADPAEPEYRGDGRIGYINLKADIGPHIHSFAHGRQLYMLPRSPADFGFDNVKLPETPPAFALPAPAPIPNGQAVPAPTAALAFRLTRYRDIEPVLTGQWLIKGLLPSRGLCVVYGPPGCGKSFVALHAVLHVAAGKEFAGRKVRQARVVYIAAEGQSGFRKRVRTAGAAIGVDGTLQFDLIEVAPNLGYISGDAGRLIEAIEKQAQEGDAPIGAIVIDTLARTMGGADENGEGMAAFIKNAEFIEEKFGCLAVAVHHTGKDADRGMRGWSGLHGACDAEWAVSSKAGKHAVHIPKMKDGEDGLEWQFELNVVPIGLDEDNEAVTTCVVNLQSAPAKRAETTDKKATGRKPSKSQREFEAAFNEALKVQGHDYVDVSGATVRAVYADEIRPHFAKRWAVDESDTRARQKKTSDAFNSALKALPAPYRTQSEDGGSRYHVWKAA